MCSFFNCAVYNDLETTIRLDEHVVFLALEDKEKNTAVHLTLNPFQIRILVKYLSVALNQIDFNALQDEKNFGDLSVQIVNKDKDYYQAESFYDDEDDYALAVPF